MIKIELKDVNTTKLHSELIKASINPILVESSDNITWITIDELERDSAMDVVKKHNPIPIEPPKSELEILRDKLAIQDGAIMELADIISTLGGV